MKNSIFLTVGCAILLCSTQTMAQDFDNTPKLNFDIENFNFKVGGRLMADMAYYTSDFTPIKSGAALTDARIRGALTYKGWYFYADFGFGKGIYDQKNISLKYTIPTNTENISSFKAGYFGEPNSMSRLASIHSTHFISRSSSANTFGIGRSLGISYNYYNNSTTLTQGIFAENKYNNQKSGFQGAAISGRWIYRPIHNEEQVLHIGASARYSQLNTGQLVGDVKQTSLINKTSLETYVDTDKNFLNIDLPWAKNVINLGTEAVYKSSKIFVRGEYFYKHVSKKRPDELLFNNQLGGIWSWTTLESWQAGNPLKSNNFQGMYLEAGYKIFGDSYGYLNEDAILKGNCERSLEIVARFNHTNANDITEGDLFLEGRSQFYPGGVVSDYPAVSTSVGGGKLNSATLGLNYTFNQYAQFMLDYTYSHLNNVYYPNDKNFNTVQARIMFNF